MPADTSFYNAQELADLLGISKSTAYSRIRSLNKELEEKGFLSPKAGLVSKKWVHERFMLEEYTPTKKADKTRKVI